MVKANKKNTAWRKDAITKYEHKHMKLAAARQASMKTDTDDKLKLRKGKQRHKRPIKLA